MKIEDKKKILLTILENLFDEHSEEINWYNCVGFYLFLIHNLEFEARFVALGGDGYHRFVKAVIDLLSYFDQYAEQDSKMYEVFSNKDLLKAYLSKNSIITEPSQYTYFIENLKSAYVWIKDDYLL